MTGAARPSVEPEAAGAIEIVDAPANLADAVVRALGAVPGR